MKRTQSLALRCVGAALLAIGLWAAPLSMTPAHAFAPTPSTGGGSSASSGGSSSSGGGTSRSQSSHKKKSVTSSGAGSNGTGASGTKKNKSSNAKCSKFKKNSAAWKKCMKKNMASLGDEDLYYAAYTLAEEGHSYAEAQDYLKAAHNPDDPRFLTLWGYTTRKLGDVDGGLAWYQKALTVDPSYLPAMEYMGEAYLQKGEPMKAMAELGVIKGRCGTTCEAYDDLKQQIRDYGMLSKSG